MITRWALLFALWILDWASPCPCGSHWATHKCPEPTMARKRIVAVCDHCGRTAAVSIRQSDGTYKCAACKSGAPA